jgi:hypothetical protein
MSKRRGGRHRENEDAEQQTWQSHPEKGVNTVLSERPEETK